MPRVNKKAMHEPPPFTRRFEEIAVVILFVWSLAEGSSHVARMLLHPLHLLPLQCLPNDAANAANTTTVKPWTLKPTGRVRGLSK